MSKVIKIASGGVLGLISPKFAKLAQAGLMIGAGITTGNPALILAGIQRGAAALAKTPKSPLGNLDRLSASIVPGAYRPMVLGSTAMATDIRYVEPSGTDQEYIDFIVGVACHKVDSIDAIWFEDRLAWTAGGGVQSFYTGYLTVNVREEGTSANTIAINGGALWGSTCRLTGCAYVHLRIKRTGNSKKAQSPLANGLPSRLTIIGNGMPLYDPRQDSTVTGGSGAHRADDQGTWEFGAIGDNAALQILGRLLGWRIGGKISVGDGVLPARIDMETFITAANLCDETVTKADASTEPRYRAAVVATEGDEPQQAYAALLAACNGRFRDNGGKLSLAIMHNDLAAAAADPGLDDHDVLGAFTWDPHPALPDSFNIVRGKYTDATDNGLYQQVDYPEVKITSIDGRDRVLPLDLIAVESPSQAQRIVKQVLQRRQYAGRFAATFSNRAWRYQVGDVVPLTFSGIACVDKLFRVADQTITYDGTCPMVLTVEDDAIYAWDADEAGEVVAATPEKFDPQNSPYILGIDEAGTTADWSGITDDDGNKPSDNADVTADNAPTISVAPSVTINADYTGAVLGGQLPRTVQATRKRGNSDVSASTTWGVTPVNCSATIDASGLIEITACSATGYIDVSSAIDGVTLTARIVVNKVLASPPSEGGSGATTAYDTSITPVSASSYGAANAGPMTVTAGSAGTVTLDAPLTYSASNVAHIRGKWQWRAVAGSWADVDSEISEIESNYPADYADGYIEVTMFQAGLTPGADYEFQLLLRRATGTTTTYFNGAATAVVL